MTKEFLLGSLQGLIRPVVGLCLRHGIKLGELLDALKRMYVACAEEVLTKKNEAISTSRITLMTGVHRTDVAQIREEENFAPRERHTASDVISQWRYDRRFCSRPGKPRVLESEGKQSEFAELVKSVSLSVSPYTVLFELERLGMVAKSANGRITLLSRAYVPKGDPAAILSMLSEDAEDLYHAVEENAFGDSEKNLLNHHLKTEFSNIPQEAYLEIQKWLMKEGSAFHERAREYLSQYDRDISPEVKGSGKIRIALASFSRREELLETQSSLKKEKDKK